MYDIIIIGAGIIGTSIARELSKFNAKILVLEKENDVSCGTTKANSGIVHAGYDAIPGSLKAKFNVEGALMYEELSKELEFPYKKNGAFVLSFSEDGLSKLNDLLERGKKNGVKNLSIITGDEVRKIEPNVSSEVKYALYAKDSGIVSPYEMAIAMAENAYTNGVEFKFEEEVIDIKYFGDRFIVLTNFGTYYSKVVVNACGVYSDKINNFISDIKYKITPRKGEYMLLDKEFSYITHTTLFQLPSNMGKGVLVAPTTHNNILVGPTALDVLDKDDVDTTYDGLNKAWNSALLTIPKLPKGGIITQFSGLRAHLDTDDYVIGFSKDTKGLYNLIGIESPGLASSPAISRYAANEIKEYLNLEKKDNFIFKRPKIKHVREMNDFELKEAIKENPLFGHIVCRCEVVSEAEIVESIRRFPGAKDLDGVKRRVRAGMGRCQMGFCTPKILEILSKELNISLDEVTKKGKGSELLVGRIKE